MCGGKTRGPSDPIGYPIEKVPRLKSVCGEVEGADQAEHIFPWMQEAKEPPTPTHHYVELKTKEESVRSKESKQNTCATCKTVQEKQGYYKEKLCKVSCECEGCWPCG